MITRKAKLAGSVPVSAISCARPTTIARISIFSGIRRRSATTRLSRIMTGTVTAGRSAPRASSVIDPPSTEIPSRRTAQKLSTHVGCMRRSS
jgi:hypothetical protein